MSPEEMPEARDAVVPPSYSTPSLAPEALELFNAFRDDVKGLRDDLVEGLEGVKQETHAGLERNAGHTLAIYRIVDQRITDTANEARSHRAEFVAFAADQRAFAADVRKFAADTREWQAATKRLFERVVKGDRITSPELDAIEIDRLPIFDFSALALRLRVPRATLRLVIAAAVATVLVSTLAACVVRAV